MLPLLILLLAGADPDPVPLTAAAADLRHKVVEAIRDCPKSATGEIVVCSKDRGIAESYRLPKLDPRYAEAEPSIKTTGEVLQGVGAAGIGSCSAVGAGGSFGCRQGFDGWADFKRRQQAARRAAEGGK